MLQRADLDAGGVHVDHHHGDALVLRRVRVGARGGQAEAGHVRAAGPHLLAVDEPTPVDPRRPGLDAGGVTAGIGLAEELAPDDLLAQGGQDPAGDLVLRPVLNEGQDHPAGDAVLRAGHARRARTPVRSRAAPPLRRRVPTAWASGASRSRSRSSPRVVPRASSPFTRSAKARTSSRIGSASGGRSMVRCRRVPARTRSVTSADGRLGVEHGLERRGPPQVEMGVVLPGEPDAPVHLDVELRALVGGRQRDGGGHRRREGQLVTALVRGPGRVPHQARSRAPRRRACWRSGA